MATVLFQVTFLFLFLFSLGVIESWASQASGIEEIEVYEIKKGDFSLKFTNHGATITSVILPDKYGKLADVVLGYETAEEYLNDTSNFGAVVGRVANRIAGAQYNHDGKQYKLVANDGKNTLHGGPRGFGKVIWKVDKHVKEGPSPYITFSYFSPDGDQGFPGDLMVQVTYEIVNNYGLSVAMVATPLNKPTPVNLAQHTYWNLRGHNTGDILDHNVQIFGSQITPVDDQLIPTGELLSVKETPYDFLKPHTVGSTIDKLPEGYDINYVLDGIRTKSNRSPMKLVAEVVENKSGRVMHLWANQPGVQFYTSNALRDAKGKGGFVYGPHAALCLETQGFPDAVNHPNFPSVMVSPGDTYEHIMLFKFSTLKQKAAI